MRQGREVAHGQDAVLAQQLDLTPVTVTAHVRGDFHHGDAARLAAERNAEPVQLVAPLMGDVHVQRMGQSAGCQVVNQVHRVADVVLHEFERVRFAEPPVNAYDGRLGKLTRFDEVDRPLHAAGVAIVESDLHMPPGVASALDQVVRFFAGLGTRLFNPDVVAELQQLFGHGPVSGRARHVQHRVELLLAAHLLEVGVAVSDAVLVSACVELLFVLVTDGDQFKSGGLQ